MNSRKIRSSIQVVVVLLLVLTIFNIINIDTSKEEPVSVSASSIIIQNTKSELEKGSLNNVSVTSDDKIRLAYRENYVEDNFIDCSKIDFKQNVKRIAFNNKIELIKNITFEKTFGNNHENIGYSCDLTTDGGYILGGDTYNGKDNVDDAWLIKLDKYGNKQWEKKYNATRRDGLHSVQQTTDGGFIFTGRIDKNATCDHDVWLVKTDAVGNLVWERTFDGYYWELGLTARQTDDGGYIIYALSQEYNKIWIIKTNTTGVLEWERLLVERTSWGNKEAIRQTTDGGYILVGQYGDILKLNSTGNITWRRKIGVGKDFSTYSVIQTNDGGYAVAGVTKTPPYYKGVGLLIKLNNTGVEFWNRTYHRYYLSQIHELYSLNQTKDNGFILVGWSSKVGEEGQDLWFVKTDCNGYEEWNSTTEGNIHDAGYSVKQTTDGGYIATGKGGSNIFYNDLLVVKTDSYGNINPIKGNFSSINILQDWIPGLIKRFEYDVYIPSESLITIQFSQDKQNWYNSYGKLNDTDIFVHGVNTIDLTNLNWHGPKFYYRVNFSSNNSVQDTPSLKNVKLYYNTYYQYGEYESGTFSKFATVSWKTLYWEADIPEETDIKLQVRSGKSKSDLLLKDFVGSEGSKYQYYTTSGEPFGNTHKNSNWFQFKFYFSSNSSILSPLLYNISISFNYIPSQPTILEPINNSIFNYSTPTFKWNFNDLDSNQEYVSWQLDDNPSFSSINLNVAIKSKNSTYEYPNPIKDGIWYWRINIKDTDGDWSPYCNVQTFLIDTKISSPYPLEILPGDKISQDYFTINWENPQDLSGIAGVYYKLDSPPNSDTDGIYIKEDDVKSITIINLSDIGKHTLYVWLRDNAGNVDYHEHASVDFIYDTEAPPPPLVQITPVDWTSINTFKVDWEVPNDISGIEPGAYYFKGGSQPTSNMDGTWTDEKPIKITDAEEGLTDIYLWLEDEAGNSDYSNNNKGVLKLDTTPPNIVHTPIDNAIENEDIKITAEVSDAHSGVSNVLIFYKLPSQKKYQESDMVKIDDTYTATILNDYVTPDGLEYFLKATDNSSPSNTIYFGIDGKTTIDPDISSDIDIWVTENKSMTWKYIEIKDHSPKGGEVNINTNITIIFNTEMNEYTVENAFSIIPDINGEFYWTDNKLLFDPDELLTNDENYTVTISKTSKSIKGYNLDENYSWTFTTDREDNDTDQKEKSTSDDSSLIFGFVIAVIIILIGIIIVIFLFSRNKKIIGSNQIVIENKEPEQPPSAQNLSQPQPQVQIETKDQESQPILNSCPNCGLVTSNPNQCQYCGWIL
jgi:hypothetical protein